MKKIILVALVLIALAAIATVLAVTHARSGIPPQATVSVSDRYFDSQAECEKETGQVCSFGMCDYIPEGVTPEQACGPGGPGKGWKVELAISLDDALKEFQSDAACANPITITQVTVASAADAGPAHLPVGTYWKSDVFKPSDPTARMSNGCSNECFVNIGNRNKKYYNSSCI